MKDKRIMSHYGKVIWYNDGVFMVAKGDGTDEHFAYLEEAMNWIEARREGRTNRK